MFKVRNHLLASSDSYSAGDGQNSSILELFKKMHDDVESRWGSGALGTVFSEHQQEGKNRRRKGLPLLTMQAALLDPRTKAEVGLGGPNDKEQVVFV